jgi:excisionase family DNA binding protein
VSAAEKNESTPEPREVMNVEQAAEFLGLSRNTVYTYANGGTIPCKRVGSRLLFSRTALVQWLSTCMSSGPSKG